MSRSINALLLSALVLPGTGQLYLKHYGRGFALIGVSLACLWILMDRTMQLASTVLDQIAAKGDALDVDQITELVAQASNSSGSALVTVATLGLGGCWLIGIVDAYRLGKREVEATQPESKD
jgi:TM2 domain-containing membrane protein YozV